MNDWFEPSQCFVLTIAMNGLNHRCVFLPYSEYAVEGVLRDFTNQETEVYLQACRL